MKLAVLVAGWLALAGVDINKTCYKDCEISNAGLALIKNFEGYSPFPYADPVGIITIGHGHVILPGEVYSDALLPQEAHVLLKKDTEIATKAVNKAMLIPKKQHQVDPVISFTFNVGSGALNRSTLLKKFNLDDPATSAEFHKWVYAGGVKFKGLVARRQAEALMYDAE